MAKNLVFIDDLLVNIFGYLNANDLTRISLVCKQWNRVSKSPELWKSLVLLKWPSQRFLYQNINVGNLQWHNAFIDLYLKSWFSPDNMKYFISCKTIEDELVSTELRLAMFEKMASVSQKWLQVYPFELDDTTHQSFDKNAELYFDTNQLKWVFLDRRRGYMRDLFPSQKLKAIRRNKKVRHIRTYQVIPSCLVLYRWLCLFKSYATAEDGLTFYRIWRFRLKHLETGKIFEIYDWKAAMNTTFSNGMPTDSIYRNDALELLDLLSHPHFIMHPLGLQAVAPNTSRYLACACAGGIPRPQIQLERRERRKRKMLSCQSINPPAQDKMPERVKSSVELFDHDEVNQTESRGIRRKLSCNILSPLTLSKRNSSQAFTFDKQSFSRQSSTSSIFSDTEDSERSEKESDVDSEYETTDTGYTSNCEYFVVTTHSFDIEEQHSIQASVSDGWMVTHKCMQLSAPVLFNSNEGCWYFPSDGNVSEAAGIDTTALNVPSCSLGYSHSRSSSDVSMQSESNLDVSEDNLPVKKPFICSSTFPGDLRDTTRNNSSKSGDSISAHGSSIFPKTKDSSHNLASCSSNTRSSNKPFYSMGAGYEHGNNCEAIPSCLAIYRLICLFDLNCSMYKSTDDSSVWCVKMLHKKTGGVMQLQDNNGWFQVHISTERKLLVTQSDSDGESAEEDEGTTATSDSSIAAGDGPFDITDFKAAVLRVLGLLMDDRFAHPYGTVAGSVA